MRNKKFHEKTCKCSQCLSDRPLDEIINLKADIPVCKDCELDNMLDIYSDYDILANFPNEDQENIIAEITKINKVIKWCLG